MAKIQKETVIITFSKLVKDTDTTTDALLHDGIVESLRDHAQGMVNQEIIVEANLELPTDSFDAWDTTAPISEIDLFQSTETIVLEQAPVVEETSWNGNGF